MGRQFAVAVIGATGLIGETLITVLEERGFPVSQLYALASNRSLGRSASFRGRRPSRPSSAPLTIAVSRTWPDP